MDEFYWNDRPCHYAQLTEVRMQGGDLTKWLEYSAEAIRSTVEQVWLRIEQFSAKADGPKLALRPKQEELGMISEFHNREPWTS